MTTRRILCKYSFAPFGAANGGIADTRMVHLQVSKQQDVVCGHAPYGAVNGGHCETPEWAFTSLEARRRVQSRTSERSQWGHCGHQNGAFTSLEARRRVRSRTPFAVRHWGQADTRTVHSQVSKQDVVCGHAPPLAQPMGALRTPEWCIYKSRSKMSCAVTHPLAQPMGIGKKGTPEWAFTSLEARRRVRSRTPLRSLSWRGLS